MVFTGRIKHMFLVTVLVAMAGMGVAPGDTREVRSLEFRGLKLLSRFELLEGVSIKTVPGGLAIDIKSLRDSLEGNPMVAESGIELSGGTLVVYVRERSPVYLMAVRKGAEVIPFQMDEGRSIVSVRAVYRKDRPLVIIEEGEMALGTISRRAGTLLDELNLLERGNPFLFNELSQVSLKGADTLEIYLKGRRTKVIMAWDRNNFRMLHYLVSFLDGRGYYPGTLRIGEGYGVID